MPYNSGMSLQEIQSRYGVTEIAKLASNENPYGPAPEVLKCLKLNSPDLYLYPDSGSNDLRDRLADYLNVPGENLIFGNGSEDLISIICRSVIETGDRIITLYPSFPLHEDYAALMGAHVERVCVNEHLEIDLPALIKAVETPAKMLIFSNPMNPVGCWLNPGQLHQVIAAKHPDTLLVLDEAYYEYAISGCYQSGQTMLGPDAGNWIILRTFSKAWGLAGLRIGFGICSSIELRRALDLTRTPFNINKIAQSAARMALDCCDCMKSNIEKVSAERESVVDRLLSLGFTVAPSLGNFVFFDSKRCSTDLADRLLQCGTVVKPWKQEGFDQYVRVSIGSSEENSKFLSDMERVMAI
ncbi:MAG: aminotransferase class I/II-fold pyridoxal phosphate-dependent enzyme [Stappiaceae bacterium]